MKTREFLEQNKERILSRISQADTKERAVLAIEDELNRILYQATQSDSSPRAQEETNYAISTVRASLPLIDSIGQIRSYERTNQSLQRRQDNTYRFLLLAGAAASVVSLLLTIPLAIFPVPLIVMAGGIVTTFIAGSRVHKRVKTEKNEVRLEADLDAGKIYHTLSTVLAVIDQNVQNADRSQRLEQTGRERQEDTGSLSEEERTLMTNLLDSAYRISDQEESAEMIEEIRFYLHKRNVEAVDYTRETARWFDFMPGERAETLRPALVCNGKLISRGLAVGRKES